MALDSWSDIKSYVLFRGDEPTDGSSDYDTQVENAIIEAWREIYPRAPWLDLVKDPPGVFVTSDDVTNRTLTIAAAGTSVAGTLSSSIATSISGFKIRPTGESYILRVTAHVAGATAITLDAAPETLSAVACTIYQDEYDLASDLGAFVDGLWVDGRLVTLRSEEWLKAHWPDPPSGATYPVNFARLGRRKIRLSHYPTSVVRGEYPYTYDPGDPSGSADLAIPAYLRPALAEKALAVLYNMKMDRRESTADQRAERMIASAIAYDERRRFGTGPRPTVAPAYGSAIPAYGG